MNDKIADKKFPNCKIADNKKSRLIKLPAKKFPNCKIADNKKSRMIKLSTVKNPEYINCRKSLFKLFLQTNVNSDMQKGLGSRYVGLLIY